MPHRRPALHDLGRPPLLPPGILSIQGVNVLAESPGNDELGALAEHPLQPRTVLEHPIEPKQRNSQQKSRLRQMTLTKMKRRRTLVLIQRNRRRPSIPWKIRQRRKFPIVLRNEILIDQR